MSSLYVKKINKYLNNDKGILENAYIYKQERIQYINISHCL